jgi:hypothetical protein
VDDLFLGGITKAELDSNGDNFVDDADDLVVLDAATNNLAFNFNATDTLNLLGVTSLAVGTDLFFV